MRERVVGVDAGESCRHAKKLWARSDRREKEIAERGFSMQRRWKVEGDVCQGRGHRMEL